MNQELIDRYIYAVVKNLPRRIRQDVEAELRTLISDLLEERCGETPPSEQDVKVVLTELGTPLELAEKYRQNQNQSLIGPPYYFVYKKFLKIVLSATLFGLVVAGFVSMVSAQTGSVGIIDFLKWIGSIVSGLLLAFAFVTIIFVFFQYRGIKIQAFGEDLSNLPPVPKNYVKISKREPISGLILNFLFVVVFCLTPQVICIITDSSSVIPLFNTGVLKSLWYLTVCFSLLGAVRECCKLVERRYSVRLVIVSAVTDVISFIPAYFLLSADHLINPQFVTQIAAMFINDEGFIAKFFINFNWYFLFIIYFALILDFAVTVIKYIISSSNQPFHPGDRSKELIKL